MRCAECGKYGVWKMRSVENAECGKYYQKRKLNKIGSAIFFES